MKAKSYVEVASNGLIDLETYRAATEKAAEKERAKQQKERAKRQTEISLQRTLACAAENPGASWELLLALSSTIISMATVVCPE